MLGTRAKIQIVIFFFSLKSRATRVFVVILNYSSESSKRKHFSFGEKENKSCTKLCRVADTRHFFIFCVILYLEKFCQDIFEFVKSSERKSTFIICIYIFFDMSNINYQQIFFNNSFFYLEASCIRLFYYLLYFYVILIYNN